MRIAAARPLFAWDCLEDHPSLKTIDDLLRSVPDAKLLNALRQSRGRGRDDYPVTVLWGALLLTILLRHPSTQSCLDELERNPSLRRLIGIELEEQVPKAWKMSRFLQVLGCEPHVSLLREVFDTMVERLGGVVKELGVQTAGDAMALHARCPRSGDGETHGELPQPTGGRKEYTDDEGNVTKVVEWFGYKLHLLVDVPNEVALAYRVSSAKAGDNEWIEPLVTEAQENLCPRRRKLAAEGVEDLPGRIETLAYDKAADDGAVHEFLHAEGVAPVVQMRSLWEDEPERMLPGHDGTSNVVYDEAGTVWCYDKESDPPKVRRMAYIGHERSRGTLKYRCPACHGGWRCRSDKRCNARKKYGKTVRVKREIDLRRFPPIPRATKKFERLYRGRSAVERVNARMRIFWGADDGNITGAERFHAFVGAVMVVHVGLATLLAACPRWEGTLGQTRLSPIAEALREKMRL